MKKKKTVKGLFEYTNKVRIAAYRFITIKPIVLIATIFLLTSCATKPQSLKLIETIKEDINQTTIKIETIDKEYKQLIIQKPECRSQTITENIRAIKSDIINLSSKIDTTEYIIKNETKAYRQEIRAAKTTNALLKVLLTISAISFTFLLTKTRK